MFPVNLKELILKIRKEKLPCLYLESEEYDKIYEELSNHPQIKRVYIFPLTHTELTKSGIENFLVKGIPIIRK